MGTRNRLCKLERFLREAGHGQRHIRALFFDEDRRLAQVEMEDGRPDLQFDFILADGAIVVEC